VFDLGFVFDFYFYPPLIRVEQRDQRRSFRADIAGSGQKVFERGLFREFFCPRQWQGVQETAQRHQFSGWHFLAFFFFAVEKEEGRHQARRTGMYKYCVRQEPVAVKS
jgi:hypothetical protein